MTDKRKVKLINTLACGKASVAEQMAAADIIAANESYDARSRRDFYSYCIGVAFMSMVLAVISINVL